MEEDAEQLHVQEEEWKFEGGRDGPSKRQLPMIPNFIRVTRHYLYPDFTSVHDCFSCFPTLTLTLTLWTAESQPSIFFIRPLWRTRYPRDVAWQLNSNCSTTQGVEVVEDLETCMASTIQRILLPFLLLPPLLWAGIKRHHIGLVLICTLLRA